MNIKIFLLLLIFGAVAQVQAQIVTDRPDQTESSSTVGRGNLQIESGLLMGFEGDKHFSTRQILAPTTLFRYGISEKIELRFVNQFESYKYRDEKIQGIGDIEIGAKIELNKSENPSVEMAFLSHLIIPSGSIEFTNHDYGVVNKFALSHDLNEKASLGYNVGYDYFGEGDGNLTYSAALGIGVTEKVGIYAEFYGEYAEFETFNLNFDAGVTYLLNDHFQLDFSFGNGVNNRMNYVSTGLSWLIGTK